MRDTHHSLVEDGHVFEELVELDILLGQRSDQIVIMHASKRQYRLVVEFCVIEPVQQVDTARARCARQTPSLPVYFA